MLPYARPGIVGASLLGLGRALGEAIAVTQVIGAGNGIHAYLFAPADTLASRIASEYQGATTTIQISSLAYLSAILLVHLAGREHTRAADRQAHHRAPERRQEGRAQRVDRRARCYGVGRPMSAGVSGARPNPLLASPPGLRRRRLVNRSMEILSTVAAMIAVVVLGIVIASVAIKGASAINLDSSSTTKRSSGARRGDRERDRGDRPAGRDGHVVAVPVGILVGIFTSEFVGPRIGGPVRFALDILNGVPTIVTGIFIFGLLVVGHTQSAYAGALALAIIMLPIVARSSHEVLALVPEYAQGRRARARHGALAVVPRIVVPTAASGLITGALLAVARIAGETAPLLFTCSIAENAIATNISQPVSSIPFKIFTLSEGTSPAEHAQAWAAALLLIVFVLVLNIIARALYARATRKMGVAR